MSSFDPDDRKKEKAVAVPDLIAELRSRLDGDERLLWTGQPDPSRVFRAALPLFFFAIPWTAFALFWELMACGSIWRSLEQMPQGIGLMMAIVFPLFGLPFIVIGIWLLGKPFSIRKQAGRTLFAITTRRALVFSRGAKRELLSFPLQSIADTFSFSEESDGSGSILFVGTQDQGEGRNRSSDPFVRGFEYIPRVREAEATLRGAIASCRGGNTLG